MLDEINWTGGRELLPPISVMVTAFMIGRVLFAAFFLGAGILHFVIPQPYMNIVPPYIPEHREMVYVSGVFEILGGLGLLLPPVLLHFPVRRFSGGGLMALLIAVEPAHIYMVTDHHKFAAFPLWALWLRIPLQLVFIWWAWLYTRPVALASSNPG